MNTTAAFLTDAQRRDFKRIARTILTAEGMAVAIYEGELAGNLPDAVRPMMQSTLADEIHHVRETERLYTELIGALPVWMPPTMWVLRKTGFALGWLSTLLGAKTVLRFDLTNEWQARHEYHRFSERFAGTPLEVAFAEMRDNEEKHALQMTAALETL